MQETWVQFLIWEDPSYHVTVKPVYHNYRACALEPQSHSDWSPQAPEAELGNEKPTHVTRE